MGPGATQEIELIRDHRILLVSEVVYREIWGLLASAGYDYLVWPDNGVIPMDGFIISVKEKV